MNGDVMIRTLCLVFAFTWFTARGARAGDVVVAANAVLINLFEVSAYLIDGFAYASEALVGQSVGAGQRDQRFRAAIWLTCVWAMVVGVICSAVVWFAGPALIDLMTVSPEVRATARDLSALGGDRAGARRHLLPVRRHLHRRHGNQDMRNMMIVSLAVFMLAWWLLEAPFGNHGLWAALNIFFVARALTFASRMPSLERRAFA